MNRNSGRKFPLFELEWVSVQRGKQKKCKLTVGPSVGILLLGLLLIATHHLAFLDLIARLLAR
jgi:hypothetical protein